MGFDIGPAKRTNPAPPSEPLLEEYVALFNDRYFFDCHEAAEDLWIDVADDPDPTRPSPDFLRGLIHAATAYHHLFRRNGRGFDIRCRSALHLLEQFSDNAHGIDVGSIRASLRIWLERQQSSHDGSIPAYCDRDVPKL